MRWDTETEIGPEQKLRIVLAAINDESQIVGLCARHSISERQLHEWREAALGAANHALGSPAPAAAPDIPSLCVGRANPVARVPALAGTVLSDGFYGSLRQRRTA